MSAPFITAYDNNVVNDHMGKAVKVTARAYNTHDIISSIPNVLFYGRDDGFVLNAINPTIIDSWTNRIIGGVAAPTGAGGSASPTISASSINGLPAANFLRTSNQYMSFGTSLGKPANFTVIVVGMTTNISLSLAQTFFGSTNNTGQSKYSWGFIVNRQDWPGKLESSNSDGTNFSLHYSSETAFVNNTFNIYVSRYTSGNNYTELFLQTTPLTRVVYSNAATTNAGTAYGASIGRSGELPSTSYNTHLNGKIAALVVANRALADCEISQIVSIFKSRYNI